MARLEGSGALENAYTLATEALRERLEEVTGSGTVAILREQRTDEGGEVRSPKTRPGIRSPGTLWAATGITPGETLKGVAYFGGGARTHTVMMSTAPRMISFGNTIHAFEPEAGLQGFQL